DCLNNIFVILFRLSTFSYGAISTKIVYGAGCSTYCSKLVISCVIGVLSLLANKKLGWYTNIIFFSEKNGIVSASAITSCIGVSIKSYVVISSVSSPFTT